MTEEELSRFSEKLKENMTFPSVYMFKFIITSGNRNIAMIETLFDPEADIKTKESGKGNYTSVTAKQVVMSVEEIVEVYRKALKIEGVMFL